MHKEKKYKLILNICFFLSLLICYIDGYKYGSEFFIQTEINFVPSLFSGGFLFLVVSILLIGQCFLLVAPFTNKYKILTFLGILFTFPFWVIAVLMSIDDFFVFLSVVPYIIFLILLLCNLNFKCFCKTK